MELVNPAYRNVQPKERLCTTARPIRVLLAITGLAAGGATNVVLDLASHLSRHPDFALHLATGPSPAGRTDLTNLAYDLGINTRIVSSLVNQVKPLTNLRAVADLRRIIVQGAYDVVHTHSSVAGVVGRLAARAANCPVVVHHIHGWPIHQEMSTQARLFYLLMERFCARYTTRFIAVSRQDIRKGLAYGIGSAEKFTLIYNGIDLQKFRQPVDENAVRAELGVEPHGKLVGMIGRLDQQKNPLDFIRTAALVVQDYADVQFLLVGDGPLRPACERLIEELQLQPKIRLLGYRNDVARILPILTLTALSSLWEGLPIAFLEAMSAGKPIVANQVDGASDVVIDGETGFLVPPHQPAQMAAHILALLQNDPFCHQLGQVAQQRSTYFSVQRMVGQVGLLYKELHAAAQEYAVAYP
jgi:glycosyltransferase involved in cell wall biosynthesis